MFVLAQESRVRNAHCFLQTQVRLRLVQVGFGGHEVRAWLSRPVEQIDGSQLFQRVRWRPIAVRILFPEENLHGDASGGGVALSGLRIQLRASGGDFDFGFVRQRKISRIQPRLGDFRLMLQRLRRLVEDAHIGLGEQGGYISFGHTQIQCPPGIFEARLRRPQSALRRIGSITSHQFQKAD